MTEFLATVGIATLIAAGIAIAGALGLAEFSMAFLRMIRDIEVLEERVDAQTKKVYDLERKIQGMQK